MTIHVGTFSFSLTIVGLEYIRAVEGMSLLFLLGVEADQTPLVLVGDPKMVLLGSAVLIHKIAVDDMGAVSHMSVKGVELVKGLDPPSVAFLQQQQHVVVYGAPNLLHAVDLGVHQVVDRTAAVLVVQGKVLLDKKARFHQMVAEAPDMSAVNGDEDTPLFLDVENFQHC